MLASTNTVAPKPAVAMPPAAQAPQPANTAGSTPAFAHFLSSQGSQPPSPEPEARSPEAAANATTAAQRRATTPPAKPAAPKAGNDGAAKADGKTADTGKADASAGTEDAVAASDDEHDDAATPQLKEFTQLIGLNGQPADAAGPDTRHARGAAGSDDEPSGRTGVRGAAGDARAHDAKGDARAAKAGDLRADAARLAADRQAAEPLSHAATERQGTEAAMPTAPSGTPNFAAALAQAMPATAATPDAPGVAPAAGNAALHAPLHDEAFGPELGARVSLMAVDGVQQAELQLNPADMGPVAVQITVDGSQAQVSFHAAQAETRQVLEQSLPDLAAALQGQGLTLSGGGVFQQARRDAEPGDERSASGTTGRRSRGAGGDIAAAGSATVAPARRSVGLLDTFA